MPRGLCIGGAADGRWIANESPHLRVAQPPKALPLTASVEDVAALTLHVDHYAAERFAVGETVWWLWRLEDMSLVQCVDRLFRGYRRP
jgi:hypothetical protein